MKNKNGYALIITIYSILIFSIIGITVAAFVATESIANSLALNALKALHIAEGGAEYTILKVLAYDNNWLDNNGQTETNVALGEGVFDFTIRSVSSEACTIEAQGFINRSSPFTEMKREVRLELSKTYDQGLLNAAYASERINLGGTEGDIYGGNLVSGSDVVVDASGEFSISSYETIALPVIDWNGLKARSQSEGNYYSADLNISSGQTLNGHYFAEGNVDIADNVTIQGSIISRGNINMNNSLNLYVSAEAGYPALIAGGVMNGTQMENSYLNGLIYSIGNLTLNVIDSVTIVGAFVCGGRISIVNGENFRLDYNPAVKSTSFVGTPPQIIVTKWSNL